jgi:hypothetical protein
MKRTRIARAAGLSVLAGALTVAGHSAMATEGLTPYLPGVSVGSAAGALPPPGTYFANDNVWIDGGVKNNSGNNVAANVWLDVDIPSVLYVPNFQILGAQYAVAIVQPYVFAGIDTTGVGGRATISNGLFNTIIQPLALSWDLKKYGFDGFYAGLALSVYINDGYYVHQTGLNKIGQAGAPITGQASIANNYWTFEPGVALSYLKDGWNATLHAVVDASTGNDTTHYQSGDLFYLDYTLARTFGKWTFDAGGNWTQQFQSDTIGGTQVGNGNKEEHVLAGPLVAYDFGPVNISAKALFGIQAENAANASFYHVAFAFPF